jgi:hypothetical protein
VEFTLFYRGALPAQRKATREDKHEIRRYFHHQLEELWSHTPLYQHFDLIDPDFKPPAPAGAIVVDSNEDKPRLVKKVGGNEYAFVVSDKIALVAELTITFLRPETPGGLMDENGDLDNRIKTLLDGLKVPNSKNALPTDGSLEKDPKPLYCLLEDDRFITSLNIKSDRLLAPDVPSHWVVLLIHVRTRTTLGSVYNLGLM